MSPRRIYSNVILHSKDIPLSALLTMFETLVPHSEQHVFFGGIFEMFNVTDRQVVTVSKRIRD